MRYHQLLNEVIIHNQNLLDDDERVYVFYKNDSADVYLLSMDSEVDMDEMFGIDISDAEDSMDVMDVMRDAEIPFFHIIDDTAYISPEDELDISTPLNPQMRKIIKQLGIQKVETTEQIFDPEHEEDITHEYDREEFINANIKNIKFYHGTSYDKLRGIASTGIRGMSVTNYEKINHDERIFITTKRNKAVYHALNSSHNNNSIPVILEIKLPDPTKLVLDYDVAIQHYGIDHPLTQQLGYDEIHHMATNGGTGMEKMSDESIEEWKQLIDKSSFNTRTGVFGYSGRIPPNHITGIYIDEIAAAMYEMDMSPSESGRSYTEMVKNALEDKYFSFKDMKRDIDDIIEEEMRHHEEDEDY